MADWLQPTVDDLKVDVLDMLKARDVDSITLAENPTSPIVGSKRWNYTTRTFQEWTGTAWTDLIISLAGGGTGNGGGSGNFGTMAYQNNDNVNITGGTIVESAIVDSPAGILARNAAAETISGIWTHTAELRSHKSIRIMPDAPSAGLERLTLGDGANSSCPAYLQAYEPGVAGTNLILSNNYYGIDGANSGRRNTSTGGSFIRLQGGPYIDFVGIQPAGTSQILLSLTPTANISVPDVLQIGTHTRTSELRVAAGDIGYVSFYANQVRQGQFGVGAKSLYNDFDTVYWRRTDAAFNMAALNSTGTFAAVNLHTTSGNIYNSAGSIAVKLTTGINQFYADIYYFSNAANTTNLATLSSTSIFSLLHPSAELIVGGTSGNAIRIFTAGGHHYFDFNNGTGNTNFRTFAGAYLGHFTPQGDFGVARSFIAPNGTATDPSITFANSRVSGIYLNTSNVTVEFGSRFATSGGRSVMRTYAGGPRVDFLIGDVEVLNMTPTLFRIGATAVVPTNFYGDSSPATANGFWSGLPTLAWYQVSSLNALNVTSDVRMKNVHGPIADALDIVDSVDTFIASFRDEFRPKEMKDVEMWRRKFPSFSAQDIREKIDSRIGSNIVTDANPDALSMSDAWLMPIMWQAIRELLARVKRLEN